MKKNFYLFLILICGLGLLSSGCFKNVPQPSETTIYSSFEEIVNPPDTFHIVFAMRSNTDYATTVTFTSNAVWKLDQLTSRELSIVWAERSSDITANRYEIINTQTRSVKVGFEGNVVYDVIARRTAFNGENINFFLQFTKLPDEDYETHTFNI